MKNNICHIVSLLCIVSMYACEEEIRTLHKSMWAHYLQYSHGADARKWYDELLSTECPAYTYKGYLQFLHANGNAQEILALKDIVYTLFKNDPDMRFMYAMSLKKIGNRQEADDELVKLSIDFGDHGEIVFYATEALVQRKELDNALSLLTNYINRSPQRPNMFVYYFLKAQIALQLGNYNEALANAKISVEKYDRFDKGHLLTALIYEYLGNIQEAVGEYERYLAVTDEPQKQIQDHMAQLMLQQQISSSAKRTSVIDEYNQALVYYHQKNYQQALAMLNAYDAKHPQQEDARLLRIQILLDTNNIVLTLNLLTQWIEQDITNELWYKTMLLIAKHPQCTKMCAVAMESIHTKNSSAQMPLYYVADFYTRLAQYDKAAHYYNLIINRASLPEHVRLKALYQLAALYYDSARYEDLDRLLKKNEQSVEKFLPLCNVYVYFYATKGNDLTRAIKLSKHIQSQQKNPHYADTLALIAYKQKKYTDAKKILDIAHIQSPRDAAIHARLAKTYYKIGDKRQAKKMMERAYVLARNDRERALAHKWSLRWKYND